MGSGDITLYYRDLYEPFSLSQLSLDRLALLRRTYMLYDFILFFLQLRGASVLSDARQSAKIYRMATKKRTESVRHFFR